MNAHSHICAILSFFININFIKKKKQTSNIIYKKKIISHNGGPIST